MEFNEFDRMFVRILSTTTNPWLYANELILSSRPPRLQRVARADMEKENRDLEHKITLGADTVNAEVELRTRELMRLRAQTQKEQEAEETRQDRCCYRDDSLLRADLPKFMSPQSHRLLHFCRKRCGRRMASV